MIDLLIDAPLLACPSEELKDEEFQHAFLEFVTALAEVSRFRRSFSTTRVWREATLASTLYSINAYPFRHALAKAFSRLDPSLGFQLEDVSSLASALLSKSNCINDLAELEDIVVNNCEISDDPVYNRGSELMNYVCRAAEFTLCHFGESDTLPGSVRITSGLPRIESDLPILRYRVDMASYRDGSMKCPNTVREIELACFNGSEATLRGLDHVSVWMNGDTASLIDALAIFSANQGNIAYDQINGFKDKVKIGKQFTNSCQHLGFLHEPAKIRRLIAACADILLGRNLDQSHWLRRGGGPNEEQRTRRSGGFAWRHDIDDEFHLHYWKNGSSIELADVVVHNDFSITD